MNRIGFVLLFLLQACGGHIQDFSAHDSQVPWGGSTSLTAEFTGAGSIDHGIGPVHSGVPVDSGPLQVKTTFTLTVVYGDSTDSASVTVDVTPPPPGSPYGPGGCVMARMTGGPLELSLLILIFALLQAREVQKKRRARIAGAAS